MANLFKALALLLLLLCGTSLVMLWHWDAQGHQPSAVEAVKFLLLLPLILFAVLLLLRWAWLAVGLPSMAAAAGSASTSTQAAPAAPVAKEEQARAAAYPVLSAHLRLKLGASASEVQGELKSPEAAPAVDTELRNAKGLPLMAARIADLKLDVLAPSLPDAERELSVATWRALAALLEPLQRCGSDLQQWMQDSAPQSLPVLRLLLQLGVGMTAREGELATGWVRQQLAEASGLPLDHLQVEALKSEPESATALWLSADALLQQLERERKADLVVLVAAHSDLDERHLERWSGEGRLFDAERQPKGLVPGEGAAVLVLAPKGTLTAVPDAPPLAHVHRPVLALRDKSIEAPGKVGHQVLEQVLGQTLALARCPADGLGQLLCDADRHGPRNTELFGAVLAQRLTLDPIDDMHLLGAPCGHLAGVGSLAAVAFAAQQAAQADDDHLPSLVLGLNDLQARLGLLVRRGAPA